MELINNMPVVDRYSLEIHVAVYYGLEYHKMHHLSHKIMNNGLKQIYQAQKRT